MKKYCEKEKLTHKNTGDIKPRFEWWDIYVSQNKIDTWEDFCNQLEGFEL